MVFWQHLGQWFKGYALGRALARSAARQQPTNELALLTERLEARLEARLELLEQYAQTLQQEMSSVQAHLDETLRDGLASLEKQVNRAGREQFKANSLAETQFERLTEALEMLRAADEHRSAEQDNLLQQIGTARTEGRMHVASSLLPVLDGLDEAQRSGRAVLEQQAAAPAPTPGLFERLRGQSGADAERVQQLREAMDAWLVGLTFVYERLLGVLAAEGIQPIEAEGQPFDPQQHVVLDVVPARDDLPPGTVAAELRRGYSVYGRVLRHAEVAVAKQHEVAVGDTAQAGDRATPPLEDARS
jgi:molecular chaperone GrpE